MTKKIAFLFSFICSVSCFSQNDTIVSYLKKNKREFVAKEDAHFIRKTIRKDSSFNVLHYDMQGNLISDETFSNWKLTQEIGEHKYYYSNGQLQLTKHFDSQSQLDGEFYTFFEDGSENFGGLYKKGKREGVWNYHYTNGNKIAEIEFKAGKVKKYGLWYEDGSEKKEKLILEKRPQFKGGKKKLADYIRRKLSPKFKKSDFKGRLILRFTINKEGRPEDIKIHPKTLSKKDVNSILGFFKEMPNWEPGIQLNRKVKVKYTLPVRIN